MSSSLAVLHVALNPVTGVWSVMRELAKAQAQSGLYAGVGIGIIADKTWPQLYRDELNESPLLSYASRTPRAFGTAQFLFQRIIRPPIDKWIDDLLPRAGADRCVVHFHNAWLSGIFLPLRQARTGRARVVATFHGVNAHFRNQPVRQRIHQWTAHRLTRWGAILTSVDTANLERAKSLLHMRPEAFTVVPNGIGDTPCRGCPSLNGSTEFTAGHVGSITNSKGWRLLVEAARKLRTRGVPMRVLLAGRGSQEPEARQAAETSGGWIEFLGFAPHAREHVMTRLDTLVLMSEQEGLPMAIIEALSVGVPVVATAVGGVAEAVRDCINGLLVQRSPEALEQALNKLIEDKSLLRKLSRGARSEFQKRFEISRILSQYDTIYHRHQ